jgi:hypothetical protein
VANVLDFGAKGDGSTDDAAAFQAAANSLASTGGVIFVPPGKVYLIGSKVTIRSSYPIWLKSEMGNRVLAGALDGSTRVQSALIRPKNNLSYIFEWARATGGVSYADAGGGGVDGVAFSDWTTSPPYRLYTIDGAINIDEALYFTVRDSYFAWLAGRGLRIGRCVIARVENTWIYQTGDTGDSAIDVDGSSLDTNLDKLITNVTGSPGIGSLIHVTAPSHGFATGNVIYIAFVKGTVEANGAWTITVLDPDTFELSLSYPPPGTASSFQNTYVSGGKASKSGIYGALWGRSMGMEQCSYGAPWISGTTNSAVWLQHSYFEDGGANNQSFVDQSAGGGLRADDCAFNGTEVTQVIIGGPGSSIRNSSFAAFLTGDTPHIVVSSIAVASKLENLTINGGFDQTGRSLDVQAAFCQLSSIYMNTTGRLNVAGLECSLSNIYMYHPGAGGGTYAIDLSFGSTLTGGFMDGFAGFPSPSVCHGVRAAGSTVTGMRVRRLSANSNGIVSTSSADVITGNHVGEIPLGGTGKPFVKAAGAQFWGNHSDTGNTHLTRVLESLTIPLNTWHNYSNSTYLTTTTTPALTFDGPNHFELVRWPANDNTNLRVSFALPEGVDGEREVTVDLFVRTENAGGGSINAASFTVYSSWDNAASVSDVAMDSSPSETLHTITATISAADIPTTPRRLTLILQPVGHVNDPIILTDVRVNVVRMLAAL